MISFSVSADGAGWMQSAGAARDLRRAQYPASHFPGAYDVWLRWIPVVDPLTYAVHVSCSRIRFRGDLPGMWETRLHSVAPSGCVLLFKRQI